MWTWCSRGRSGTKRLDRGPLPCRRLSAAMARLYRARSIYWPRERGDRTIRRRAASRPHPRILLGPLTTQEAVLSSRIEGTQATLGEVLEYEAEAGLFDANSPKTADILEVLNYRAALAEGTRLLEHLPLSQRLIRETHRVLMQGVRGRNKAPGEYRRIPVWIGPQDRDESYARFIPVDGECCPISRSGVGIVPESSPLVNSSTSRKVVRCSMRLSSWSTVW